MITSEQILILILILIISAISLLVRCCEKDSSSIKIGGTSSSDGIQWENIHLFERLGSGVTCSVFRASLNGKNYALRRCKVLVGDIDLKTLRFKKLTNEMKFYKFVDTIKPDMQKLFMRLYGYRVYKGDYKNEVPEYRKDVIEMNKKWKNEIAQYEKSPLVIDYLLELGGQTLYEYMLENIRSEKPLAERYKIVLQILTALKFLRDNDYIHADIHASNILCELHDSETESTGPEIKLIDYGKTYKWTDISKRGELKPENKYKRLNYQVNIDLQQFIGMITNSDYLHRTYFNSLFKSIVKFPPKIKLLKYIKSCGQLDKCFEIIRQIHSLTDNTTRSNIEEFLTNISRGILTADLEKADKDCNWYIYGLSQVIFDLIDAKKSEEYWRKYIPDIKYPPYFIPDADIMFMYENFHNMDKIIKYIEEKNKALL